MPKVKTFVRPVVAWASVAVFLTTGAHWIAVLAHPGIALGLFAWLFVIIIWVAFGVVHEAEELAEILGEPLGTLVLTLSIVIIEVALISAAMLGAHNTATLARDTMFSVLMIVLNGVVGLGLLMGGIHHHEQSYNLQGASAYLSLIIPLATIALVLPTFTTSTPDGSLTRLQAAAFSAFTIVLYGLFLWLQTGRHRGYFMAPIADETVDPGYFISPAAPDETVDPIEEIPAVRKRREAKIAPHVALLFVNILPIVILSRSLDKVIEYGIAATGAPHALGGILIAMLAFTPEGLSALIAIRGDQLTRAINLCLGGVASTLGLTVPAVLAIGIYTGHTVVLGLPAASIVLLASTLILSVLTFTGWRTTMLEGAVHLTMFAVFLVLVFRP